MGIKGKLQALSLTPKKSLSQNFLIDPNIVRKLTTSAKVTPKDLILEIGPGTGIITENLLAKGAEVIAVEKDAALIQTLAGLQTEDHRLHLHLADILTFPVEERLEGKRAKIVANLPYHISSPILTRFAPLYPLFDTLTVIVQKEVALRYVASPNTSDYSSISVYLQFFSSPKILFSIPKTCFFPPPKIESAAITFTLKKPPLRDWDPFFEMVRSAFQQKRKMLRGSLGKKYPTIKEALKKIGKKETTRPQELSADEFVQLYRAIKPTLSRSEDID